MRIPRNLHIAPRNARLFTIAAALAVAVVAGRLSASPSARAVLAGPNEPGEPLEVAGAVYEADGRTPASGVRLVVYHADSRGFYSEGGQDRDKARLSAELVTGADGRYSFRTIVPGYYPGGGTPRHIHFQIATRDGRRASTELRFADDPVLEKSLRVRAREAVDRGDRFFDVRPVERAKDGVKHCTFDLRLPPRASPVRGASG